MQNVLLDSNSFSKVSLNIFFETDFSLEYLTLQKQDPNTISTIIKALNSGR